MRKIYHVVDVTVKSLGINWKFIVAPGMVFTREERSLEEILRSASDRGYET
jgi:hypothetical protein